MEYNMLINSQTASVQQELIEQKLKIAEMSLQLRNTFWDGMPKNRGRNEKEFDDAIGRWYDAMAEYDKIERKLLALNSKETVYGFTVS